MEDRTGLLRDAAWDQERLKDLLLDEGSSVDEAQDSTSGSRIIASIAPELERLVDAKQLTPYLPKRDIVSSTAEYQELTRENATQCERSRCLRDILFATGRRSRPWVFLRNLYLALLDSHENDSGEGSHRHLAVNCLREQILRAQGIDRQEYDEKQKNLTTIFNKLGPVIVSGNDALAFRQKLGLENLTASESTESVGQICEEWLQRSSSCSLVNLVKALLCVRGLGKLVSQLVPLCFCNTQQICTFVRCLHQQWPQLALYLGYSQEEIDAVVECCPPNDIHYQIKMFLRMWWMPSCGRVTQAILDELKTCAGIVSASTDDCMEIYRPHETKGQAGGDERTDTHVVQSNLVTVYQNYYCWPGAPPPVQGAVPGAGMLTQQPQGATAFNPVPGLGMPAIPFPQWPAASPQSVPQAAHTVPTEQANVQILPESSDQLITETTATHTQPISKPIATEQTAKLQPLVEESRLLTQHSSLETEEQQPKVDDESTMDRTTTARDESRNEGAALLAACMNSEWDMGKALVNSGSVLEARSNPDRKTPLLHTCIKGEIAIVKYLVQHGADITAEDSDGLCCLHFHEVLRNEVLMKYLLPAFTLLDHSIDMPDKNKYTPLLVGCTLGDSVINSVRLLLDHEANPDGNSHAQCRPLVEASARGHEQTVKLLLQYNAKPDIQDVSGCTALLKACNCRQSNIIRLLLVHGVSVNRSDHDGTTPLFSAVSSNAREVVQQLIQKGAHVNITRYRTNPMMSGAVEETPLAHACAKGFLEIVELLVLSGADLNYLCSGTVPPLGFAVICKQMHIVKYLLRNSGIDKSLNGMRAPIVIAVKVQNIAYARLIIAELGGEEKALKMANQENMYQLAEHIELYMALKKDLPDSVLEEADGYNPVQAHVQDPSYYKTGQVMQSFAEVCVTAVSSVVAEQDTASVITHLHHHAGEFLNRCTNGTQDPETLRRDLLSGNPSPFKFFIDNNLLTADNFQIQAFARYGDHASKFCDELMQTFRQMPGGQSLPNDIHSVLMRIFSGQLGIGCQVTSSCSGRDSLPQELWPWWDSEYRSLMRQSQQSSMPQSASKLEECLDRYMPSPVPQLEAQCTAVPTTAPVPAIHNHSRHSANQEAMKQNTSHSAHHPGRQQSEFVAGNCPVPPQSSSAVASIRSPPTVEVTSFSDSKAQGSTSHKEETVDHSKDAYQPASVLQQRDTNQHPTFSYSASKMSSAIPANFPSNHSTPSQSHLVASRSYSSSSCDSSFPNSNFASTPIRESAHQLGEECVRSHPQTPQKGQSDSAYLSDQSSQDPLEPVSPVNEVQVQQSHFNAETSAESQDRSTAELYASDSLCHAALQQNIPVLYVPPETALNIDILRRVAGPLLVMPIPTQTPSHALPRTTAQVATGVSRSDSCPEYSRRPLNLSLSGRSESYPRGSSGSSSSFHLRTSTSTRGTEKQSAYSVDQRSSKTIPGDHTE